MRDSAFGPIAIPPDFWTRTDVISALTARDIGQLFRLIQQWTGVSQTRIGVATGNAQGRVSEIINGKSKVKTVKSLTRVADGLGMPRSARTVLGLGPGASGSTPAPPARPIPSAPEIPVPGPQYPSTIDRAIILSTGLWQADGTGSPEALAAPLDPSEWNGAALAWLLSQPDSSLPSNSHGRAVGRSDVARVRDASVVIADLDNRFGGALARRTAVHLLNRDAAALLAGRYGDETGRELFAAVAEATLLAGFLSADPVFA